MSRIGFKTINIPAGVEVKVDGNTVSVKGPKGQLQEKISDLLEVEIKDGVVWINGAQTDEPYVTFHDTYNYKATVPADSYLALGDNRPNSADSRFWGFVPAKNVYGPVSFRYWPLNRIGLVK